MKKFLKMKNNKLLYIALILSILSFLIIFLNNNYNNIINYIIDKYSNKVDTVYVTDTLYKDTTLYVFKDKLVPKYIEKVKTDTFYTKEGKDTIFETENKVYQDTLICEKDTAEFQIFTSGIKSNVDSINLKLRKSETIITNTVEITKYIEKKRTFWNRFSIGPAVTAGYDPINKQWGVLAGASVTFDIK